MSHLLIEFIICLKNNYIYIADKKNGVIVIDINSPLTPVATFEGRGTWKNLHGSVGIEVGDDGKIYLSDFNAGVIIIEPYDITLSIPPVNQAYFIDNIKIYPNPTNGDFSIHIGSPETIEALITIYDLNGRKVFEKMFNLSDDIKIKDLQLNKGEYLVTVRTNDEIRTKKIIIN